MNYSTDAFLLRVAGDDEPSFPSLSLSLHRPVIIDGSPLDEIRRRSGTVITAVMQDTCFFRVGVFPPSLFLLRASRRPHEAETQGADPFLFSFSSSKVWRAGGIRKVPERVMVAFGSSGSPPFLSSQAWLIQALLCGARFVRITVVGFFSLLFPSLLRQSVGRLTWRCSKRRSGRQSSKR